MFAMFIAATLAAYALRPLRYRRGYVMQCESWARLARRKLRHIAGRAAR